MNRLIVIAEKEEFKLIDEFSEKHGNSLKNVPVLVTGVGALNIINALKDIPKDTEIINIGYAGSKNLPVGVFYPVKSSHLYHPNVFYTEPVYTLNCYDTSAKACYTGTDFVLESNMENCLFDMELGYIMALGFHFVKSYKYVSDNLDLQEYRKTSNEKE